MKQPHDSHLERSRRRRLGLESLESRRVLAAVPFGATADDTAEFMLGDVLVSLVLFESDGSIDPNTEDWTTPQIESVKKDLQAGMQWWVDLLDLQGSVHELTFRYDFTHADQPVRTGYEPIARPSEDVALWIDDFFAAADVTQGDSFSEQIRQFNHRQRLAHETHWAFTVFVINSQNDADGRFDTSGDHLSSFAYAGGRFFVTTSGRQASTYAHEAAHMFWAMDEYAGGKDYDDSRGYYNTQNLNALIGHPNPSSRVRSIMDSHVVAFPLMQASPSSLQSIGWLDSDGDGIFDVLDVPLELSGQGEFDQFTSRYHFSGHSQVGTLPNRNSSGTGNAMTINQVSRAEVRFDDGAWQAVAELGGYEAAFELEVEVPFGATRIEIRTVDAQSGVVSAAFSDELPELKLSWQNQRNPLDVNDDLSVSPLDALLVINHLNQTGPRELPRLTERPVAPFLDTNGDGYLSPLDALLVINDLNRPSRVPLAAVMAAEPAANPTLELDAREQLLIELINRARANPLAEAARYSLDLNANLEPGTITSDPKQPLAPHQALINAARGHSLDMLRRNFFAHENPDGDDPGDRARAAGYGAGAGENIAWYGTGILLEKDAEVYRRHEALYRSESHRTNTFTDGWREIGTGIQFGEFDQRNSIMVTENFGNRGGDFFITGVAYTDEIETDRFYTIREGLGDVTITAKSNQGGTEYVTTTGVSGGYSLRVPSGVYAVSASGGGLPLLTVNAVTVRGKNEKVDFIKRDMGLASISGTLFHDLDRDGVRDPQEPALANREVYIDSDGDGKQAPVETVVRTDADGNFRFEKLRAGDYRVAQAIPPGWEATGGTADPLTVKVLTSQNRAGVRLGSYQFNAVPVALPDQFRTESGQKVTMDVFANDSDADGEVVPAETRIETDAAHGDVRYDPSKLALVYFPDEGFVGTDTFAYRAVDDQGLMSEPATVVVEVTPAVGLSWQNPTKLHDVSGDNAVSPLDALLILNDLNSKGSRRLPFPQPAQQPPPFLDVSGDSFVSPIDALLVLNELNRITGTRSPRAAVAAEAEAVDAFFAQLSTASDLEA